MTGNHDDVRLSQGPHRTLPSCRRDTATPGIR